MACSDDVFASAVARLCIARFNALPKTGKALNNEWTVLAGIVQRDERNLVTGGDGVSAQHHSDVQDGETTLEEEASSRSEGGRGKYSDGTGETKGGGGGGLKDVYCGKNGGDAVKIHGSIEMRPGAVSIPLEQTKSTERGQTSEGSFPPADLKVVALGTGSKCLGTSRWCPKGTLVHDGHAEVVAKRSFQLYLLDQMEAAYLGRESVFRLVSKDEQRSRHVPVQDLEPNPADVDSCVWVRSGKVDLSGQSTSTGKYTSPQSDHSQTEPNTESSEIDISDQSTSFDTACSDSKKVSSFQSDVTNIDDVISSTFKQKLVLANGVSFHMFISHTPCGDCSIFPKDKKDNDDNTGHGDIVVGMIPDRKKPVELSGSLNENGDNKSDGAKCEVSDLDIVDDKNNLADTGRLEAKEFCDDVIHEPSMKKFKPTVDDSLNVSIEEPNNRNPFDLGGNESRLSNNSNSSTNLLGNTKLSNGATEPVNTRHSDDIHRTGAKCVSGETKDLHLPGSLYHNTGALRTKPGRGDTSLSHCCSDKLVKWSVLGLQGSLLSAFCETPIHLTTLIIGSCPFSYEAMERGLFSRFRDQLLKYDSTSPFFKLSKVKVLKCDVSFGHSRIETRRRLGTNSMTPCPSSISWHPGYGERSSQVIVNGRKLGVTKKALGTVKSQVSLCRYQVMAKVVKLHGISQTSQCVGESTEVPTKNALQHMCSESKDKDHVQECCNISYRELKRRSVVYNKAWVLLRQTVLTNWTAKPDHLQNFVL